jgi:hypothetical protein
LRSGAPFRGDRSGGSRSDHGTNLGGPLVRKGYFPNTGRLRVLRHGHMRIPVRMTASPLAAGDRRRCSLVSVR